VPIELTSSQWISAAGIAIGVILGVSALRRNQRWRALLGGLIALQSVGWLVVPNERGHSMRYLVSVPVGIAVLAILRRVSDEAKLAETTQADVPRSSRT